MPGEYAAGALTGRDVRLGTNVCKGTVVNVGAGEEYDTVTITGRFVDGDSGKRVAADAKENDRVTMSAYLRFSSLC